MEVIPLLVFLSIVLLGSFVQAVAGFAMGLIIVAVVGGLRLIDLPTLAAVVSLTTILNVLIALWGQVRHIHRRVFTWLALGQLPAIFVGLQFMLWLEAELILVLELLLGLFITAGGLSMFLKPQPWREVSSPMVSWSVGVVGGLVGGMFSASGPVLGWFGYNQPLPLAAIRATLLACFVMTTGTRSILVGIDGGLTPTVWSYALWAVPVVVVGTWVGRRAAPRLDDSLIRRGAYILLLVMGVWIVARSGLAAFSGS